MGVSIARYSFGEHPTCGSLAIVWQKGTSLIVPPSPSPGGRKWI